MLTISFATSPPGLPLTIDQIEMATPTSLWWPAGSQHSLNSGRHELSSPNTRARGSIWSDNGTQGHTVFASAPATLVAYYEIEHFLTLESELGNAECDLYWCWYTEGANASFSITASPGEANRTRKALKRWVDVESGESVSPPIRMDGPRTLRAVWVTQFHLVVDPRYGAATCDVADCWYDEGALATVTLQSTDAESAAGRQRFSGWKGDANSSATQITIIMDGPKAVAATWTLAAAVQIETPLGVSFVVVLVVIAMAGTAYASTPRGELALASLSVPLFTRLRRADVRGQYHRGRLIQFIEDNPGANYSEIRRKLQLSNGGCAYHLGVLERSGDVRRVSHSATVRFYPANYKFDAEALPPLAFVQRRVLEVLVARGSAGFGEISRALAEAGDPVGEGNLSHHLRELARTKELVATRREGRTTIYFLPEERRKYIAERLQRERGVDAVLERETFGAKDTVAPAAGDSQGPDERPATAP